MSFWLRMLVWIGWLGCLCLFSLFSSQGCMCAQHVTIPGLDAENHKDGGLVGTEALDAEKPPPFEGFGPEQNNGPEADGGADSTFSEPPPETVGEPSLTGCPNPNDLACLHCRVVLGKNERVLVVHKNAMLTSKDYNYRWFDLRTCASQPWSWLEQSLITVLALDPDSSQVLLAATQVEGTVARVSLGLFDLAQPFQPLRVLRFPERTEVVPRYPRATYHRRGVITIQERDTTGKATMQRLAHFQMQGSHLVEIPLPAEHEWYVYNPAVYLEAYELFLLSHRPAGATRNRFPLLIWSVKNQRLERIIDRGERSVPLQMFASEQDIFVLEVDPADRNKKDLIRYPIAGGAEQKMAVPGCSALWGDNQLGILACLQGDKIYRFRLPVLTTMPVISLPVSAQSVTYDAGFWYLRSEPDTSRWFRVHLADGGTVYDTITFPGGLVPQHVAGEYPTQRSSLTLPGTPYRILRTNATDHQKLGILHTTQGKVFWFSEKFPTPAIMGRLTEMWSLYDSVLVYYVEPESPATQQPSLYYIRITEPPEVLHVHMPGGFGEPPEPGESVLPTPTRIIVHWHRKPLANDPGKFMYELFILHCKSWKKQSLPLQESHRIYVSDPWVVLAPDHVDTDTYQVQVYRVP